MTQTALTSRQSQIVAILDRYFERNAEKKNVSILDVWLSTTDEESDDLDAFEEELFDLFGTNGKSRHLYEVAEVKWWNGKCLYQIIEKVVQG